MKLLQLKVTSFCFVLPNVADVPMKVSVDEINGSRNFVCMRSGRGTEERNDAIFTIVRSFKIEQSFYEDSRA